MTNILHRGTRRLLIVGAGLALAAAGIVSSASVASANRPAAAPQVAAPAAVPAIVAPGSGTLAFDWGCDGSYSSTTITFAAGGTFTTGDGGAGTWVTVEGMLTFTFNAPSRTTYSSVMMGSTATGINTTFAGLNGCHNIRLGNVPFAATPNLDSRRSDGLLAKS